MRPTRFFSIVAALIVLLEAFSRSVAVPDAETLEVYFLQAMTWFALFYVFGPAVLIYVCLLAGQPKSNREFAAKYEAWLKERDRVMADGPYVVGDLVIPLQFPGGQRCSPEEMWDLLHYSGRHHQDMARRMAYPVVAISADGDRVRLSRESIGDLPFWIAAEDVRFPDRIDTFAREPADPCAADDGQERA